MIKSYIKLSVLSEITIKPQESKTYLRFAFILYLMTFFFVLHSAIPLIIQIGLLFFLMAQFRGDWKTKSPRTGIKEINYGKKEWTVLLQNNKLLYYSQISILIHNELFQLIRFTNIDKKKLVILFNDQITKEQLRFLHLKACR